MCGDPSRRSVGGTIAMMRPPVSRSVSSSSTSSSSSSSTSSSESYELLFSNNPQGQTRATIRSGDGCSPHPLRDMSLTIHLDGDLRNPDASRAAMHYYDLSAWNPKDYADACTIDLPGTPLSFSVGDGGIIGRRVSLTMGEGGMKVAEGVIGWN